MACYFSIQTQTSENHEHVPDPRAWDRIGPPEARSHHDWSKAELEGNYLSGQNPELRETRTHAGPVSADTVPPKHVHIMILSIQASNENYRTRTTSGLE